MTIFGFPILALIVGALLGMYVVPRVRAAVAR